MPSANNMTLVCVGVDTQYILLLTPERLSQHLLVRNL